MNPSESSPRPSYNLIQDLLRAYTSLLRQWPILTKSGTSALTSCLGSSLQQVVTEGKVNCNIARSFLLYGGLVSGPITHFLYIALDKIFPGPGLTQGLLRVLTDRLIFSPAFLFLTIYLINRLQGRSHRECLDSLTSKYKTSLLANWKIWTLPQIVNINLVPAQYRVLFANMVAFVWNFYLASVKNK